MRSAVCRMRLMHAYYMQHMHYNRLSSCAAVHTRIPSTYRSIHIRNMFIYSKCIQNQIIIGLGDEIWAPPILESLIHINSGAGTTRYSLARKVQFTIYFEIFLFNWAYWMQPDWANVTGFLKSMRSFRQLPENLRRRCSLSL